ncbi:uncharacterized protein LOC143276421 [Babylonia areolata]|uniref:uncharacterized protein LOC143276421 n=1 Tax=Babylonia areolata TaxID=304850 RepID=UPI003FCF398F
MGQQQSKAATNTDTTTTTNTKHHYNDLPLSHDGYNYNHHLHHYPVMDTTITPLPTLSPMHPIHHDRLPSPSPSPIATCKKTPRTPTTSSQVRVLAVDAHSQSVRAVIDSFIETCLASSSDESDESPSSPYSAPTAPAPTATIADKDDDVAMVVDNDNHHDDDEAGDTDIHTHAPIHTSMCIHTQARPVTAGDDESSRRETGDNPSGTDQGQRRGVGGQSSEFGGEEESREERQEVMGLGISEHSISGGGCVQNGGDQNWVTDRPDKLRWPQKGEETGSRESLSQEDSSLSNQKTRTSSEHSASGLIILTPEQNSEKDDDRPSDIVPVIGTRLELKNSAGFKGRTTNAEEGSRRGLLSQTCTSTTNTVTCERRRSVSEKKYDTPKDKDPQKSGVCGDSKKNATAEQEDSIDNNHHVTTYIQLKTFIDRMLDSSLGAAQDPNSLPPRVQRILPQIISNNTVTPVDPKPETSGRGDRRESDVERNSFRQQCVEAGAEGKEKGAEGGGAMCFMDHIEKAVERSFSSITEEEERMEEERASLAARASVEMEDGSHSCLVQHRRNFNLRSELRICDQTSAAEQTRTWNNTFSIETTRTSNQSSAIETMTSNHTCAVEQRTSNQTSATAKETPNNYTSTAEIPRSSTHTRSAAEPKNGSPRQDHAAAETDNATAKNSSAADMRNTFGDQQSCSSRASSELEKKNNSLPREGEEAEAEGMSNSVPEVRKNNSFPQQFLEAGVEGSSVLEVKNNNKNLPQQFLEAGVESTSISVPEAKKKNNNNSSQQFLEAGVEGIGSSAPEVKKKKNFLQQILGVATEGSSSSSSSGASELEKMNSSPRQCVEADAEGSGGAVRSSCRSSEDGPVTMSVQDIVDRVISQTEVISQLLTTSTKLPTLAAWSSLLSSSSSSSSSSASVSSAGATTSLVPTFVSAVHDDRDRAESTNHHQRQKFHKDPQQPHHHHQQSPSQPRTHIPLHPQHEPLDTEGQGRFKRKETAPPPAATGGQRPPLQLMYSPMARYGQIPPSSCLSVTSRVPAPTVAAVAAAESMAQGTSPVHPKLSSLISSSTTASSCVDPGSRFHRPRGAACPRALTGGHVPQPEVPVGRTPPPPPPPLLKLSASERAEALDQQGKYPQHLQNHHRRDYRHLQSHQHLQNHLRQNSPHYLQNRHQNSHHQRETRHPHPVSVPCSCSSCLVSTAASSHGAHTAWFFPSHEDDGGGENSMSQPPHHSSPFPPHPVYPTSPPVGVLPPFSRPWQGGVRAGRPGCGLELVVHPYPATPFSHPPCSHHAFLADCASHGIQPGVAHDCPPSFCPPDQKLVVNHPHLVKEQRENLKHLRHQHPSVHGRTGESGAERHLHSHPHAASSVVTGSLKRPPLYRPQPVTLTQDGARMNSNNTNSNTPVTDAQTIYEHTHHSLTQHVEDDAPLDLSTKKTTPAPSENQQQNLMNHIQGENDDIRAKYLSGITCFADKGIGEIFPSTGQHFHNQDFQHSVDSYFHKVQHLRESSRQTHDQRNASTPLPTKDSAGPPSHSDLQQSSLSPSPDHQPTTVCHDSLTSREGRPGKIAGPQIPLIVEPGTLSLLGTELVTAPRLQSLKARVSPLERLERRASRDSDTFLARNKAVQLFPERCGSLASPSASTGSSGSCEAGKAHLADTATKHHEPVLNTIGDNSLHDVLYILCRLCLQTYGDPFEFFKHFRNQHGFEPKAEHALVHTTSTLRKSAAVVQIPGGGGTNTIIPGTQNDDSSCLGGGVVRSLSRSRTALSEERLLHHGEFASSVETVSTRNTSDTDSGFSGTEGSGFPPSSSDAKDTPPSASSVTVNQEGTKCLECPECGQTFQLNDFGTYKRHCRQHGLMTKGVHVPGVVVAGGGGGGQVGAFPKECQTVLPDVRTLQEHRIVHHHHHVEEGRGVLDHLPRSLPLLPAPATTTATTTTQDPAHSPGQRIGEFSPPSPPSSHSSSPATLAVSTSTVCPLSAIPPSTPLPSIPLPSTPLPSTQLPSTQLPFTPCSSSSSSTQSGVFASLSSTQRVQHTPRLSVRVNTPPRLEVSRLPADPTVLAISARPDSSSDNNTNNNGSHGDTHADSSNNTHTQTHSGADEKTSEVCSSDPDPENSTVSSSDQGQPETRTTDTCSIDSANSAALHDPANTVSHTSDSPLTDKTAISGDHGDDRELYICDQLSSRDVKKTESTEDEQDPSSKKTKEDLFVYKHKKFSAHRKRSSGSSEETSEAVEVKKARWGVTKEEGVSFFCCRERGADLP